MSEILTLISVHNSETMTARIIYEDVKDHKGVASECISFPKCIDCSRTHAYSITVLFPIRVYVYALLF